MKIFRKAFFSIFVLFFTSVCFNCSSDIPVFDEQSAFSYLTAQTDFGPRNPGSEGHELCLEYLSQELSKFAERTVNQPFGFTDEKKDTTYSLSNIIASFALEKTERILLCAHWDTRPMADKDPDPANRLKPILGANDGASGVAVLLEVAKIMKENPPPVGIDIVLFDGEDYGEEGHIEYYFLGSRYFAQNKGQYQPKYGILLDLIGDKNQRFPLEGHSLEYAPEITEMIWEKAQAMGLSVFVSEIGPTIDDDHLILNQAGIPTVNIIDFDYEFWHTINDTPENCSAESLGRVGKLILAIIYG